MRAALAAACGAWGAAGGAPGAWDSRTMVVTHYWDCSGQGCDSTTLQPWDPSVYVSPPGYAPQDPGAHGGALYGERMWLTGAASDTLASMMGADDGCCGRDTDSGACGKCLLIKNPDAVNADWTAVIMKKNRCPPWSNGCGAGTPHFDVAAPGFDNLQYSTANICGQAGTGFDSQQQSAAAGSWYNQCQDTEACAHLCDSLPAAFVPGCRLFASWGWRTGNPSGIQFQTVACPAAFKAHVGAQFGEKGPTGATAPPAPPTPAPLPTPAPPATPAPPPSSCPANGGSCDCAWAGAGSCGNDDGSECNCKCCCPITGSCNWGGGGAAPPSPGTPGSTPAPAGGGGGGNCPATGDCIASYAVPAAAQGTVPAPVCAGVAPNQQLPYTEALRGSMYFYAAQRGGEVPCDFAGRSLGWRGSCFTADGPGQDGSLKGGWFDAGDHMKFSLPMSWSASTLAWGGHEYKAGYIAAGALDELVDNLKYAADWFVAGWEPGHGGGQGRLIGQVDDGSDHNTWQECRSQPKDKARALCWAGKGESSEITFGVSAALAATAHLITSADAKYDEYKQAAVDIYAWGRSAEGGQVCNGGYYTSDDWHDEKAWAGAWLHKLTGDAAYLVDAEAAYSTAMSKWSKWSAGQWQYVHLQAAVLLWDATGSVSPYKADVESKVQAWISCSGVDCTPGGLRVKDAWGSLRLASNAALLGSALGRRTGEQKWLEYAQSQVDYILGDNPSGWSYVVGIGGAGGTKHPVHPHHRSDDGCAGAGTQVFGALVGGPTQDGNYVDRKDDYTMNEVATDYNAGWSSVLASIASCLDNGVDDCAGYRCPAHSACVDVGPAASCECDAGWGPPGDCSQQDGDDCAGDPCGAHGACTDGFLAHTCDCDQGWRGAACDEQLPAGCASVNDGSQDCSAAPECCATGACFRKNQYWAGCQDACTPGMTDSHDTDPWACTCLSSSCPGAPPGPPATPQPPLDYCLPQDPSVCACDWTQNGHFCKPGDDDGTPCWCRCCCPYTGSCGAIGVTAPPPTPQPPAATPQPPAATPQPPAATPQPPAATPQPPAATPQPAAATPQPPAATPQPPAATPQPPAATPQPPAATPQPPAATPQPPAATPQPPAATPQPPAATPQPPAATPQPPAATPQPPAATPQPPAATPTPPAATPTPPAATPTPPVTVATPTPPAVTPQPPPATPQPTPVPTTVTTPAPGGAGPSCHLTEWLDCTDPSACCAGGLVCYEQSQWYWQCLHPGTCPSGWSCAAKTQPHTPAPPAQAGCAVPEWGQCGGPGHDDACCTGALVCYEQSQWYSQCLQRGSCPGHWSCAEKGVAPAPAVPGVGDACGCDEYRYGAAAGDRALCRLRGARHVCDPSGLQGQCDAMTHSACGGEQVLTVLIAAAEAELRAGAFQHAAAQALGVEARNLVMRWYCPADVCQHGCPATEQQREIARCIGLDDLRARRQAPLGGADDPSESSQWVASLGFAEDEEANTERLGRAVHAAAHGWDADDEQLAELRRFITPRSNLNVKAGGEEEPALGAGEAGGSSVSPAVVAAAVGGVLCAGAAGLAALYAARTRSRPRFSSPQHDDGDERPVPGADGRGQGAASMGQNAQEFKEFTPVGKGKGSKGGKGHLTPLGPSLSMGPKGTIGGKGGMTPSNSGPALTMDQHSI